MSRTPRIPPPPPSGIPKPPSCGWIGNTDHLTLDEITEICQINGVTNILRMQPIAIRAYAAVAYARRLDPAAYPWETAKAIPTGDIQDYDDDDEDEIAEAFSAAAEQAIEDGQEPPDPASSD